MEKEKKISFGLAVIAIFLMLIVAFIYLSKQDNIRELETNEVADKAEEQETVLVLDEKETVEDIFEYQGEMPDIFGKEPDELYENAFICTEEETESAHCYIEGGVLFFDEYADTGKVPSSKGKSVDSSSHLRGKMLFLNLEEAAKKQ